MIKKDTRTINDWCGIIPKFRAQFHYELRIISIFTLHQHRRQLNTMNKGQDIYDPSINFGLYC